MDNKTEAVKKPPIGLINAFLVIERRVYDITSAILRYEIAEVAIPDIWIDELKFLIPRYYTVVHGEPIQCIKHGEAKIKKYEK